MGNFSVNLVHCGGRPNRQRDPAHVDHPGRRDSFARSIAGRAGRTRFWRDYRSFRGRHAAGRVLHDAEGMGCGPG